MRPGTVPRASLILLLLGAILAAATVQAADDGLAERRRRLAELEQQIEATLKDLSEHRSQEGALDRDLAALQDEIRQIEAMARASQNEMKRLQQRIAGQQQAKAELQALQAETRDQVQERLVALYKAGEVGLLRVLFAASGTPQSLSEKYTYLSRIVRHDQQLIRTYRSQAETLQATLTELERLRQQQTATIARHRSEQKALEQAEATKQRMLAKVRSDRELLDQALQDMRAKAARLNQLVKKLETDQAPSYTESLPGLADRKGHLQWPANGPVRVGFGTNRQGVLGTLIESNGLEIALPVGSPVKAIAPGRVIFAKPLRGYGKLMILDHGGKDYSLYAHVASFAKRLGDEVAAGEQVATSGHEGRDSLYFEIRHGGQPLDPLAWLKPR